MANINVQINGKSVEVPEDYTILKAAKAVQIQIPTLCAHPDLPSWSACGLCVVKVAGSPKLVRSCTTKVVAGLNYLTHDQELYDSRQTVLKMILANHPNDCLGCVRNTSCELQTLTAEFGIRKVPYQREIKNLPADETTQAIVLDPYKCIQCGRCVEVCQQVQNVWALEFLNRGINTIIQPAAGATLAESPCIKCGQCAAHCPVGAIYEMDHTERFMAAIADPGKHVVVQIAPAIRVAIGEEFGLEAGEISTGKLYSALRALGVDTVFDSSFSADLTIMEEANEFAQRLAHSDAVLPQITTCCPAWVDYMEKYCSDMMPHCSSAKSPMMMQGAMTKTYYAQQKGLEAKQILSAAIMPCTAKKYEIDRDDHMRSSGEYDMDLVLTTRELARLLKQAGIDFVNLPESPSDSPIGEYSGAGVIFGATGGVMEAALRSAHYFITGKRLEKVEVECVRGMAGIRKGELEIEGKKIRVAIAHGMNNVSKIVEEIRQAKANGFVTEDLPFHFVEVMACPGGCIGGGGQPYSKKEGTVARRIAGIHRDDAQSKVRFSFENPSIKKIYAEFLGSPLSEKSHELLHTHYHEMPIYKNQ